MFAFDDWKRNINEYCKKYSRVVFSVCHSESFSLAQKADCVFVFGGLEVFQFFCLTKSCHLTLLLTSSLPPPPGCLDRLFICPAWARKGYCESKRRLMQKHCPSSCDFCYGKKQQWQRHQESRGKEKKRRQRKFSLNWAAQGAAVNRLPMEQREPTGPAMQSCAGGFQGSDL